MDSNYRGGRNIFDSQDCIFIKNLFNLYKLIELKWIFTNLIFLAKLTLKLKLKKAPEPKNLYVYPNCISIGIDLELTHLGLEVSKSTINPKPIKINI